MLSVMAPFPYSINARAPLTKAQEMFETHHIRHLPVMENDDIIGVISEKDLSRAVSLGHKLEEEPELEVGDLVHYRPYMVDVSDPVPVVVEAMMEKKIGSAIVLRDGEIVGIFTSVDALKHYCKLLHEVYDPPPPGTDAA